VTFDADGGAPVPEAQKVEEGQKATKPADPTKEGFTFEGWYNGETEYDFNTPVTGKLELKAKWTETETPVTEYDVTFDADGGAPVPEAQKVEAGKTATEPTAPTKDGYKFDGWYNGETKYDFTAPVTGKLELKAKWTETTTPAEGEYTYGEPEWDKSDFMNVTATFTAKEDPTVKKVVKATLTYEFVAPTVVKSGEIIYTAKAASPDGTSYSTTWKVLVPPLSPYKDNGPTVIPRIVPTVPTNPPVKEPEKAPAQPAPAPAAPEAPAIADEAAAFPFTDVDAAGSFYNAVKFVYDNGIMNGVAKNEFAPYSTLTRGMIVTILYRVEKEPAVSYSGVFTDVPADTWYTDGVEWAAMNGIVNGYGNGKFGPDDPVTREQLAAILYRYANFKGYEIKTNALIADDAAQVSAYAIAPVNWAVENNVLLVANSLVRPTELALRWEIATAIQNFCLNVAK